MVGKPIELFKIGDLIFYEMTKDYLVCLGKEDYVLSLTPDELWLLICEKWAEKTGFTLTQYFGGVQ